MLTRNLISVTRKRSVPLLLELATYCTLFLRIEECHRRVRGLM